MGKNFPRPVLLAIVFGCIATIQTGAFAGAPRLFNGEGINWLLNPVPITVQPQLSRVQLGSFLFVQPLRPAAEAVPKRGQTGALPGLFHTTMATVTLDAQRFIPVSGGLAVTPFCSVSDVTGRGQRLCLVDSDNDGTFDYQVRAFGLGNGDPFAPMMLARGEPASIPYTIRAGQLEPVMNTGLVLRKEGGAYSLRFAVSAGGKPKVLELFAPGTGLLGSPQRRKSTVAAIAPGTVLDGATTKFTAEQLPLRIGLLGAVLEIVEVKENSVTYRVLSSFDQGERIPVSRAGVLPMPL